MAGRGPLVICTISCPGPRNTSLFRLSRAVRDARDLDVSIDSRGDFFSEIHTRLSTTNITRIEFGRFTLTADLALLKVETDRNMIPSFPRVWAPSSRLDENARGPLRGDVRRRVRRAFRTSYPVGTCIHREVSVYIGLLIAGKRYGGRIELKPQNAPDRLM